MELDFEKDVLKLMKLLAYKLKSTEYRNPHISNFEEYFGTPWLELYLEDEELADIGIPRSRAKLLQPAVYEKQGMNMNDFTIQEYFEEGMPIPPDRSPITIHTLFWIDKIIKGIEDETLEVSNLELFRKDFDKKNFIILNGLTGDFTYNKTSGKLTIDSRKLNLLRALLRSKDNFVNYDEIAKVFFKADQYNKAKHSKGISDVLDDLKRDLEILGNKLNPDCFDNEPGVGYRLLIR